MRVLELDPSRPRFSRTLDLGGTTCRLTFTWRDRTASWYVDLHDAAGAPLALGRRLTPGRSPFAGVGLELPASLLVLGRDPYIQGDLGTELLEVVLIDAGDVAALEALEALAEPGGGLSFRVVS